MKKYDASPPVDPRKGIQSVEIGLRLAQVLTHADGPLPLKALAQASGMSGSAAHRYLISLVRAGLVVQLEDGRYGLGRLALHLGLAALEQLSATSIAEQNLREFCATSGETAMLSLWSENGPVVLRWIHGERPVYTTIAVGSVVPLTTSATGMVFLTWLSEPLRKIALRKVPPRNRTQLIERMAVVRARGFAEVSGNVIPGLNAVAVPMFDGRGDIFAVFTAVTAGQPLAPDKIAALRAAAHAASAAAGYRSKPLGSP